MRVRFGVFTFDTDTGDLSREGVRVRLEPQPGKALARLVEQAGDVVSRDELRALLWGGDTHVDFDRGLAYCVGQIRAALGDSADHPRFIQTLPRRGFRFIAPVERVVVPGDGKAADAVSRTPPASHATFSAADPARPGTRASALAIISLLLLVGAAVWAAWPAAAPRDLVAVAVFDNETGDPAYDGLTAAVADAIVLRLTPLAPDRVAVIGNSAVLRQPRAFRDPAAIQRATGAGYLIFGQLQREARRLRLVTHLIRLDDDTHLWVTRIVRPEAAAGEFEARMVDRVAEAVTWHLLDRRPDAPRSTPEDAEPEALPPSP
ncbi:MAG: winged helix-turn-helix domain-containing protein [Vicinamibacterales bacterium]|nr:winged helix-turn-helix domain-containing protein [Vicinamibacterales bacterium]